MNTTLACVTMVLLGCSAPLADPVLILEAAEPIPVAVGDSPCFGCPMYNIDGTMEAAVAWQNEGLQAPYYGFLGEALFFGHYYLTCAGFLVTCLGPQTDAVVDVYVWEGGVNAPPSTVVAAAVGVTFNGIAIWPEFSTFWVPLDYLSHYGDLTLGFCGGWTGDEAQCYLGVDLNGFGGWPWTMVAPGLGLPEGWQSPGVIDPRIASCRSLAVIYLWAQFLPVESTTWGQIKGLFGERR